MIVQKAEKTDSLLRTGWRIPSEIGPEIAEDPQSESGIHELAYHAVHSGRGKVSREINEEHILPVFPLNGTGFQLDEIEAVPREYGEDLVKGSGMMGSGQRNADLVSALRQFHDRGDDDKTGRIVGVGCSGFCIVVRIGKQGRNNSIGNIFSFRTC